jgi:hypothetical protein
MKYIVWVLLTAATMQAYAQDEKVIDAGMVYRWEYYYNAGKYDSIYTLLGDNMKKAIELENIVTFFTNVKVKAGNVQRHRYVGYEASMSGYVVTAEKANFRLDIAVDEQKKLFTALRITEMQTLAAAVLPTPKRNSTPMQLPFNGKWTVVWGGDTKEDNYHVVSNAQKNAFDMVMTDDKGSSYKNMGNNNEDYYAWGQKIVAPCNGTVVTVIDGIKDNKPGERNEAHVTGNSVTINAGANEYVLIAHLQYKSMKVKEGDKVTKGQLLGLCGNTGNSTEPHLHMHLMNSEDLNIATGIKCYFEYITVTDVKKTEFSPIRGQQVENINK